MDTESTRAVIEQYYAALLSGDKATWTALIADDCEWVTPASTSFGPVVGKAAIVDGLTSVVRETYDLSARFEVTVRSMLVDGNKAAIQQRVIAKAKATGEHYDNEYCWVYIGKAGKIVHMEEYADTYYAAEKLGTLP